MTETAARYYSAFGLTVRSELDLPELPQPDHRPSGTADVVIRQGALATPPVADGSTTTVVYSGPDQYYLLYEVATLRIQDGREIVVDASQNAPHEVLRHVVLGPGFNYLLHQRGQFVLHASTVAIGNRAVAFLGESGQGKTTTAMGFLLEGYPVLSDDVAPVEFGPQGPTVRSGYPALKLDPAVVDRFDVPVEKPQRTSPTRTRHFHGLPGEQPTAPLPLVSLYVLKDAPAVEISRPTPGTQFIDLVEHTYTRGLLEEDRIARSNFDRCTSLLEAVPVQHLRRPREFDVLPALVERVVENVEQLERGEHNDGSERAKISEGQKGEKSNNGNERAKSNESQKGEKSNNGNEHAKRVGRGSASTDPC